jgi:hypothetical protein
MNWLKSDGLSPDIYTFASAILVYAKCDLPCSR